jgi:hypothetical protein
LASRFLLATTPTVRCKVFEDNVDVIELAKAPKLCPWMKHITIQHHHFHSYGADKLISIQHVMATEQQVYDIATKPLPVTS